MLLFQKDIPTMAAQRYEMNDQFFVRLFADPEMMNMIMESVGGVLYERLKKKKIYDSNLTVSDETTPETYVKDIFAKIT